MTGYNKEDIYTYSDISKAICDDISSIFLIDRLEQTVSIIRTDYLPSDNEDMPSEKHDYYQLVKEYIKKNVYEDDQAALLANMDLDYICDCLREKESVNIFYRVYRDNRLCYFRLKCTRTGDADGFSKIVYAFINEDFENSQIQMINAQDKDSITGLYKKAAFYPRAEELLEKNPDKAYDLIVTDVDNFKLVNMLNGRSGGDRILRYLADTFSQTTREGICARYGADQFVLLSKAMTDEEIPLFSDLTGYFRQNSPLPYLNIKYGIYRNVDRKDTIAEMCDKAMLALRSNKSFRDNPVSFYDDEVIRKHYRAQMHETRFERALANREFVVWCQPKYNSFTKKMTAAEALVRWQTEEGLVPPGEFIPVFEADGFIVSLDEYVFRYVCGQQKMLLDSGCEPIPISVNMSRATLFKPGVVELYTNIIEEIGVPKEYVPLEITESAMDATAQIGDLLTALKDAGFELHMDDFGSGYSSLSSLTNVHFDGLKLDKTLIDGIGNKGADELLKHIIELAHFLQLEVIAEGVEVNDQYNFLKKLGCDTIQGYLFSRPLPYDEFLELYHNPEEEISEIMDSVLLSEEASVGSLRITNDEKLTYLSALASIFMTLHVVDLEEDTVVEFNTTTNVKAHCNKLHNAPAQMKAVMSATVAPEDLEAVLEFTDLLTLPQRMRGKRTIAAEFMGKHFGLFRARFVMITANEKDEPVKIIYTTIVVDAKKRNEAGDKTVIESCRTDELTGVLNKSAFDEDLTEISSMVENEPEKVKSLVVMCTDINELKKINQTAGHSVGDELIWGSADILNSILGEKSRIYRVGGDRFIAFFCASSAEIDSIKKKYETEVENWMGNNIKSLSTSYGIAGRADFPDLTLGELMAKADERRLEYKKRLRKD